MYLLIKSIRRMKPKIDKIKQIVRFVNNFYFDEKIEIFLIYNSKYI